MKVMQLAIVGAVLAATGAGAWFTLGQTEAAVQPPTAIVGRGNIEQTVLASGTLEASAVVSVGAEVSGRIEKLNVGLGDPVSAGQVIAEIDSLNQENAVKSAQAALANMLAQKRAKAASVLQAELALARSERLIGQKVVSQADYETAAAALEIAKADVDGLNAQIDQATLTVESAQLNLSRTKITAPVSGTVVAVLLNKGASVNAASSTPIIIKIAQLDTMIIKAQISEADVTKVHPGQRAYFSILGEPDNRIEATLLSTEPAPTAIGADDKGTSSDSAVYYNGVLEVDNPDHKLRIAMTAQVTIVLAEVEDGLLISSGALGRKGPDGRYLVQVYDPTSGKVVPTPVEIGLNNNIMAEVKSGLEEGQQIVTTSGASSRPTDGARSGGGMLGFGGPPSGMGGGRPRG